MLSCQSCGNICTCKDNRLRHRIQYCKESARNNVSTSDAESFRYDGSDRDDEKSINLDDFSSNDLVTIISNLLKDHRRKWKKTWKSYIKQ